MRWDPDTNNVDEGKDGSVHCRVSSVPAVDNLYRIERDTGRQLDTTNSADVHSQIPAVTAPVVVSTAGQMTQRSASLTSRNVTISERDRYICIASYRTPARQLSAPLLFNTTQPIVVNGRSSRLIGGDGHRL